jgi:DNA-binding XRE family transcriptional regulator
LTRPQSPQRRAKQLGQNAIARGVRMMRNKLEWTQADLARNAGVHPDTVSRIESGQIDPVSSTVYLLAQAMFVSPDTLYGITPSTAWKQGMVSNQCLQCPHTRTGGDGCGGGCGSTG